MMRMLYSYPKCSVILNRGISIISFIYVYKRGVAGCRIKPSDTATVKGSKLLAGRKIF